MNTKFIIICFSLTAGFIQGGPSKKAHEITQPDQAGPYLVKNDLSPAQREELLSRIRGFLWDHWYEKRRGQLQTTVYTVEGDPTSYTFSIEEDSKGRWCILARSESMRARPLKGNESTTIERKEVTYYDIERLDMKTNAPFPKSEKRLSEDYRLALKNPEGPKHFVW